MAFLALAYKGLIQNKIAALLFFICCTHFMLVLPAYSEEDLRLPRVVVDCGGPYECRSLSMQRYSDVIKIPYEYLYQPLSMVCTNGSEKAPGFSWVRMFLMPDKSDQNYQSLEEPIGRLLVNEDSFAESAMIFLDLSNQLKPGRNIIKIEAGGRPGAIFSWEIRSIGKPQLYMADQSATTAGAWLNIYGSGFSLRPGENSVQLGPMQIPVAQCNSNNLQIFIPKECPAGNYDLSVAIRSYRSRVIKLEVISPRSK